MPGRLKLRNPHVPIAMAPQQPEIGQLWRHRVDPSCLVQIVGRQTMTFTLKVVAGWPPRTSRNVAPRLTGDTLRRSYTLETAG